MKWQFFIAVLCDKLGITSTLDHNNFTYTRTQTSYFLKAEQNEVGHLQKTRKQ